MIVTSTVAKALWDSTSDFAWGQEPLYKLSNLFVVALTGRMSRGYPLMFCGDVSVMLPGNALGAFLLHQVSNKGQSHHSLTPT